MSGIGRVPSSPAPVDTDTDHATPTVTTPSAPAAPVAPVATSPIARPMPPSAPPSAGDIVPARILTKYGLDPTQPSTDSKYEGDRWSVGYFPYFGDIQYVAFGKYKDLFDNPAGAADLHGYWESYGNPPTGLAPGSWIADGSIDESNFELATGVDITGDRPIDNAAYKLMREAGAPKAAKFALRDASGKQLALRPGDKLVPTVADGAGKLAEVEVRGNGEYFKKGTSEPVSGDVVWRLKGGDGAVRGAASDKAEDRFDLAGAKSGVKFDFLDAAGEPVQYDPRSGDQIVATYKDGNAWHAFVPKKDAGGRVTGYEHQTLDADGRRVTARETVDPARAAALQQGKDLVHRIEDRSGALKGDGAVSNRFDMGWWGKCHNVASIGASSMKMPETDVKVVTNLGASDKLGLQWTEGGTQNVLVPKRGNDGAVTGYTLRAGAGAGAATREISAEEGARLATEKKAGPIVVTASGALKPAEVTTFATDEVTAMVAHMGDGAVEYKGSVGARFYGYPDQIQLKDGSVKGAFITSVETESGKKVEVGSKSGTSDFREGDRSVLRGPGLDSRRVNSGYRTIGWSQQSFAELQASKSDKVKNVTVAYPDGRTETIGADEIATLGWENRYDVTPTDLWGMHKMVGLKGSSVVERDPGTHVWNYTVESMSTKPIKKEEIPSYMKDAVGKPGMMHGTTGDDGKYFFKTSVNGMDYTYWAKFDPQGNLSDYAYLDSGVPDFFWTQHVKDPVSTTWTGEAQAPGARMEDIQRVYNASTGRLKRYELPGGFLGKDDLARRPVNP